MKKRDRQSKLVDLVRDREKVSVEDLAAALGASRETIRRDLSDLARAGTILKVHGGAMIARLPGEGPFRHRMSQNVAAKARIARAAAQLFRPGETLMIDTGSTTLFLAEELAGIAGLTVVTNATEIARTIARARNGSRAFLLGGEYGLDNSQTIGAMVTGQIRLLRAHHAVLTVGALDHLSGAMDYDLREAEIAQAMIAQARRVTVLADASKFGALASFQVCPLARIDTLVSDTPPPPEIRESLEASGGRLVLCEAPEE